MRDERAVSRRACWHRAYVERLTRNIGLLADFGTDLNVEWRWLGRAARGAFKRSMDHLFRNGGERLPALLLPQILEIQKLRGEAFVAAG